MHHQPPKGGRNPGTGTTDPVTTNPSLPEEGQSPSLATNPPPPLKVVKVPPPPPGKEVVNMPMTDLGLRGQASGSACSASHQHRGVAGMLRLPTDDTCQGGPLSLVPSI